MLPLCCGEGPPHFHLRSLGSVARSSELFFETHHPGCGVGNACPSVVGISLALLSAEVFNILTLGHGIVIYKVTLSIHGLKLPKKPQNLISFHALDKLMIFVLGGIHVISVLPHPVNG